MKQLSEIQQLDYERLLPYFEQNTYSCAEIARKTNMASARVVTYFSRYLVQLKHEKMEEKLRCPSCQKYKNEVSDMKECRDVFHYL